MEAQLILSPQDGAAAASNPAEPARGRAGCRLPKAAALMVVPALLAVASLSLLWAQPPQDRSGASRYTAQPALATLQAYQEVAPGSQRFVQQPMAALPGIPDLQMSVEMLGLFRWRPRPRPPGQGEQSHRARVHGTAARWLRHTGEDFSHSTEAQPKVQARHQHRLLPTSPTARASATW